MQIAPSTFRAPMPQEKLKQKRSAPMQGATTLAIHAAAAPGPLESAKAWLFEKALPAVQSAKTSLLQRFFWLRYGSPVGDFKTREELDCPSVHYVAGDSFAKLKQYRANAAQEGAAVVALGPRADSYRVLAKLCETDMGAQIALQNMLLDGRLAKTDSQGGHDALFHLNRAAKSGLLSGEDLKKMMTDLIEEMEDPTKISQGAKGTCAATSATIMLTRRNPAEYARLIADLASPAGQSTLVDGTRIVRDRHWNDSKDKDSRTTSLRLLQPALMNVGNGYMGYDNQRDVHNPLPFLSVPAVRVIGMAVAGVCAFALKPASAPLRWAVQALGAAGVYAASKTFAGGLVPKGFARVEASLTGEKFEAVSANRFNKNNLWKRVEEALAAGKPVEVGLVFGPGGHALLAERIEKGYVYYTNPWGQTERMGVDEFKARMMGAALPVA